MSKWTTAFLCPLLLLLAPGCQGKCVSLNEEITPNQLNYHFTECSPGAAARSVVCDRQDQTSTFACACTEDGEETATFETQGPAPGVMSNGVVTYETLFVGCGWTDVKPFLQ